MTDQTAETTKIKPDDNPWYRLATLYGEPTDDDEELQARNRVAWNRCMATRMGDELQTQLTEAGRHAVAELTPLSGEAWDAIEVAFAQRSPGSGAMRVADLLQKEMSFSNVEFGNFLAIGLIFLKRS